MPRPTLAQVFGALILLLVAGVYVRAGSTGRMPPSHPWSGFTLTMLGTSALLSAGQPRIRAVGSGLALIGAALWLVSATSG